MDDSRAPLRQWIGSLGVIGNCLLRGSCYFFASEVQCLVSYCHALSFHTSRQSSPLLVSRRPEIPPGCVGPCARECARSSRRGGVKIDGAKVHQLGAQAHCHTVAESILWTKLCGVQFATEVAATVSLDEVLKGFKKAYGCSQGRRRYPLWQ